MMYASVQFFDGWNMDGCEGSQKYSYKSLIPVKRGDLVVVQVRDSVTCGPVWGTSDTVDIKATKFIVATFSLEQIKAFERKETLRKVIEKKLDKKLAEVQKKKSYELLKDDEEARRLINELAVLESDDPQY